MKSKTIGYFLVSIFISIILFFLLGWILQPSDDEGTLLTIGILISLQISFLTGWAINKLDQIQKSFKRK